MLYIVAAKLLLHLLTVARYGIFRDEMYYLAVLAAHGLGIRGSSAAHGVDRVVFARCAGRFAVGCSPAAHPCRSALVWLHGQADAGDGRRPFCPGAWRALAVVVVPVYLVSHHWLTDNVWEPLIWMACIWLVSETDQLRRCALLDLVRSGGWNGF